MVIKSLFVLGEDSHMDISQMLDTSLGEPSPSHPFPGWPAASDLAPTPSQDTSSPGKLYLHRNHA